MLYFKSMEQTMSKQNVKYGLKTKIYTLIFGWTNINFKHTHTHTHTHTFLILAYIIKK